MLRRALVVGTLAGALFLGLGTRLAMRGVALIEERAAVWTIGGTLRVMMFGALFGLGFSLLWAAIVRRLPGGRIAHGLRPSSLDDGLGQCPGQGVGREEIGFHRRVRADDLDPDLLFSGQERGFVTPEDLTDTDPERDIGYPGEYPTGLPIPPECDAAQRS
mgnify:CR=1 FL=1